MQKVYNFERRRPENIRLGGTQLDLIEEVAEKVAD
jgi:hypothetical protein